MHDIPPAVRARLYFADIDGGGSPFGLEVWAIRVGTAKGYSTGFVSIDEPDMNATNYPMISRDVAGVECRKSMMAQIVFNPFG